MPRIVRKRQLIEGVRIEKRSAQKIIRDGKRLVSSGMIEPVIPNIEGREHSAEREMGVAKTSAIRSMNIRPRNGHLAAH